MTRRINLKAKDHILLLKRFNSRERAAFGEVYLLFYDDLHNYTNYLYQNSNIDSGDIINDTFVYLWQNKNITFDEIIKIKGYLFIMIKNGYKNYIKKLKTEDKYNHTLNKDDFMYDVIECEVYSIVEQAIGMLPTECAKVFRLYIEGFKPEEIAQILGKKVQTVYNKKQEAILIIRKHFSKDIYIIALLLGIN